MNSYKTREELKCYKRVQEKILDLNQIAAQEHVNKVLKEIFRTHYFTSAKLTANVNEYLQCICLKLKKIL